MKLLHVQNASLKLGNLCFMRATMHSAERARRWSLPAVVTSACLLSTLVLVSPFFLPAGLTAATCRSKGKSFDPCSRALPGTSFVPHDVAADVGLLSEEQRPELYSDGDQPSDAIAAVSKGRARRRGDVTMERPSGQFQRLAKPKFDPDNPNAVLGEIAVPGLRQVSSTHARTNVRITHARKSECTSQRDTPVCMWYSSSTPVGRYVMPYVDHGWELKILFFCRNRFTVQL